MRRVLPGLCTLLLTIAFSANGQEPKPDEKPAGQPVDGTEVLAGHSYHGEAFNEGPRQKAYLMGGTGPVRFPVTSEHPLVRRFIEQGLGQVHGYWYLEAERSFRHAAMLDPDCAIAYWGMALANRNNSKRSKGFIAEAMKRKTNSGSREQMHIEALNTYINRTNNSKERTKRLVEDLERIVQEHPDDLEAKAFLAHARYRYRSTLKLSYEQVEASIKEILAVEPMHPVHHYLIHLWDVKDAKNALASAARAGQAAPNIAHMWHMPGHIYARLKRHRDAAWQQEASARVDHAHMMRDRVLPDQIHNFAHNNEWLIRTLIYLGRHKDGVDLAKNMIELPRHPKYNTLSRRGSTYYGRLRLFSVLSQFELWDQLIAAAHGQHLEPTDVETEQIKRLRYLGVAYVRKGDASHGRRVLGELKERLEKARAAEAKKKNSKSKGRSRSGSNTRAAIEKAIAAIEGYQAEARGDFKGAMTLLRKAGEDKLHIAKMQLLAGEKDAALKAAESFMRLQQKRTQPAAQYVEFLWLADKKLEAAKAFNELRDISGSIQFGSPVFSRLAPIAKELKLPSDWRIRKPPADDVGDRPPLASLGPFRWRPMLAAPWSLKDAAGRRHTLRQYRGKPVVVIFYLGYGCLHCAEQLQAFAPQVERFRKAGIEVVAISTDDGEGLKKSLANYPGGMPFPLLSDADMNVFKAYRAFDDFENTPLHGTFLIDEIGLVRWQDISYEPFMDAKFALNESLRLLGKPPLPPETRVADKLKGEPLSAPEASAAPPVKTPE